MKPSIRALFRFFKYSLVGGGTFLFDMALLLFLIYVVSVDYIIATPLAFLFAVSINYLISRNFVFRGTKRTIVTGFFYFIALAFSGAIITGSLVYAMVEYLALPIPVSRILAAGVVGIWTYLANLYLNFKVAGKHF